MKVTNKKLIVSECGLNHHQLTVFCVVLIVLIWPYEHDIYTFKVNMNSELTLFPVVLWIRSWGYIFQDKEGL